MLSVEDNELLTRVTGDAPMGRVLRSFWLPFLFGWEVEAAGPPLRVRLFGEDLIAFRGEHGNVALVGEHCPHRRASLYFGRNEAGGVRCLYHGWKFDGSGSCVDMPSEPDESTFKSKVGIAAYVCEERCGVVWTYMGPNQSAPPPLPRLEWMGLPESHHVGGKRVQPTNWAQALEGEIDQSHVSFVHSRLDAGRAGFKPNVDLIRAADRHPHFEVVEMPYGHCIAAGRNTPDGQKYWRITQQLLPTFAMTGPYGPDPKRMWRSWVPIDDENVLVLGLQFHPRRPLSDEERANALERSSVWNISAKFKAEPSSKAFGNWYANATLENDYFQDREAQRTSTFSGIPEFWAQDAAMQVSMGTVCDRSQEHLGTSDLAIISVRKRLLAAAKAMQDAGTVPPESMQPDAYAVRSDAVILAPELSWFEATKERRLAIAGTNPDCPS